MGEHDLVVVSPVYGNAETLPELVRRVAAALDGREWRLHLVVDACPRGSARVARGLASERVRVTELPVNVGQHRALAAGLAAEPAAAAWACLDADLQDPPEALPLLLERLRRGDVDVVFAGRRGAYESPGRVLTGRAHRWVVRRLTGLPADAGACFACTRAGRDAVLERSAPSVVLAMTGMRATSLPVQRAPRAVGTSAWTSGARFRQSARSLVWALRTRAATAGPRGPRSSR